MEQSLRPLNGPLSGSTEVHTEDTAPLENKDS